MCVLRMFTNNAVVLCGLVRVRRLGHIRNPNLNYKVNSHIRAMFGRRIATDNKTISQPALSERITKTNTLKTLVEMHRLNNETTIMC